MINLYDAIFHRKSIRKYDMNPLPSDTLEAVKQYVRNVEPLIEGIKVEFTYLSSGEVKNILPIRAPHYLCIYSEKVDNYLMNAGFMLQQADLYLSSRDIGSCWLGMARPEKAVPQQMNGMGFVIMLAFGNSAEPIHRMDTSEFKRRGLSEISTAKSADDILKAVHIAPSASNSQPWFFTGDEEKINVYRARLGIIKAALYDNMNQIDIGIALCHLFIAARVLGKEAKLMYDKKGEEMAPKGYQYMISVAADSSGVKVK